MWAHFKFVSNNSFRSQYFIRHFCLRICLCDRGQKLQSESHRPLFLLSTCFPMRCYTLVCITIIMNISFHEPLCTLFLNSLPVSVCVVRALVFYSNFLHFSNFCLFTRIHKQPSRRFVRPGERFAIVSPVNNSKSRKCHNQRTLSSTSTKRKSRQL